MSIQEKGGKILEKLERIGEIIGEIKKKLRGVTKEGKEEKEEIKEGSEDEGDEVIDESGLFYITEERLRNHIKDMKGLIPNNENKVIGVSGNEGWKSKQGKIPTYQDVINASKSISNEEIFYISDETREKFKKAKEKLKVSRESMEEPMDF